MSGLTTTFRVLGRSSHEAAVRLLLESLQSPREDVRELAAFTLLERPAHPGRLATLRILPTLSPRLQHEVRIRMTEFVTVFQEGLRHGPIDLCDDLIIAIRRLALIDLTPAVLDVTERPEPSLQHAAIQAVRALVGDLWEQWLAAGRSAAWPLEPMRQSVLERLARVAGSWESAVDARLLVESLMLLGRPRDPVAQRGLWHGSKAAKAAALDVCATARHPGVIEFLWDAMDEAYPPAAVFTAFSERADLEFVSLVLDCVARTLTSHQRKNLKQLTSVAWLETDEQLAEIPDELQPVALRFSNITGLPRERRREIEAWFVRHGTLAARQEASRTAADLNGAAVHEAVIDSLNSEDAETQVWAISQLRDVRGAEAMALLVEQIEHPHPEIRHAALSQLKGFTLERALEMSKRGDPETVQATGRLLRRIDPQAVDQLAKRMLQGAGIRRVEALRAAQAFGWTEELLDEILEAGANTESMLRRAVIDAVEGLFDPRVDELLDELSLDSSLRVREAAIAAVRHRGQGAATIAVEEAVRWRP